MGKTISHLPLIVGNLQSCQVVLFRYAVGIGDSASHCRTTISKLPLIAGDDATIIIVIGVTAIEVDSATQWKMNRIWPNDRIGHASGTIGWRRNGQYIMSGRAGGIDLDPTVEGAVTVPGIVPEASAGMVRKHDIDVSVVVVIVAVIGTKVVWVERCLYTHVEKSTVSKALEEGGISGAGIVGKDVHNPIIVEVSGNHAIGISTRITDDLRRIEAPIALADIDLDLTTAHLAANQVKFPITVQIGKIHSTASHPKVQKSRGKTAIPIAERDHCIFRIGSTDKIRIAVIVEITRGHVVYPAT